MYLLRNILGIPNFRDIFDNKEYFCSGCRCIKDKLRRYFDIKIHLIHMQILVHYFSRFLINFRLFHSHCKSLQATKGVYSSN